MACGAGGAAVGVAVTGLHKGVEFLQRVSFNLPLGHGLSTGVDVDLLRILFVPLLGGLTLGLGALIIRHFGAREVVDPIEANALHGGRMSLPASLRLVVATLVSNASGAAVGMEAGYSQLGASMFSFLGSQLSLRRADQRIFVGAGAAAAIAAAFNAPLAGAFYGFELHHWHLHDAGTGAGCRRRAYQCAGRAGACEPGAALRGQPGFPFQAVGLSVVRIAGHFFCRLQHSCHAVGNMGGARTQAHTVAAMASASHRWDISHPAGNRPSRGSGQRSWCAFNTSSIIHGPWRPY